jgi:CRP/FNR family transcriptional regulator, dissimilatory nitrate respiration regulator
MGNSIYSVSDLAFRLSSVKHFRRIQPAQLEQIVMMGSVQAYRAGEIIFQEDSPGAGLFVLLSGQVQLCKLSPQGQNAILAVFDPVIMFNEVPALDQGPNPVTAISADDSMVWRLDAERLEELVLQYPHVGYGLLRVLASRNRHLVAQFEDLSFRSVLARAAKLLVELSAGGTKTIDRRKHPGHQMAARIATVPEAFSRTLKIFRTNGDICCTGSTIEVTNAEHLKEIASLDQHGN